MLLMGGVTRKAKYKKPSGKPSSDLLEVKHATQTTRAMQATQALQAMQK
jgi:hypothetical protein